MNISKTVTDKNGNVISLCSYNWTSPDGHTETCKAHRACEICGQCSRLDGERELGHCTGHGGLNEHILGIPGRSQVRVRDEIIKKQVQIREQNDRRPRRKSKNG